MGMAWSRQQGDAARAAAREHTRRCRERRRLMREAVRARRQLAASHAGYLGSLGLVASALTHFALGEPLPVSDHTPPAVLVHRPAPAPSTPPPLLRSIQPAQQDGAAAAAAEAPPAAARTEGGVVGGEDLRVAVRHRSLAEVAAGLEEYFLRATAAGDPVSKLLEAGNAEYSGGASSFFGVLCCMSSSSSPSVSHDGVDGMHDRIGKRHSSTLQQLMVWEKKLYKEVKARERLQVRHDKKLAALRDQEYSRKINVDIQKLKGAWDRARAQLATASEAAHAGSAAISELRDTHLARQVLGLCHATRDMWKAMRQHHEAQCLIAQQLRGLSGRTSMDATTEIQHGATRALEAAMSAWCAALGHLAKHQRDYVAALHGWLKLTLAPSADGAPASPVAAELAAFVDRWRQALDGVHCAEVLKSIKNFAGATHALYAHQGDELRAARRVAQCTRELDRKSRMLRQVEKSHYDSYAPAGLALWNRGRHWMEHDMRQVHHAHNEVVQRKEEIDACRRKLEGEMKRHAMAIDATRSSAVAGVQRTLPAVFQAMATFSASLATALDAVCRHGSDVQ
ncbi:protein ROLLING AND ERECT LEAF 2-like [Triticum dicoccoides]|uniref:protein ROLLING AND ERECT LEAF 2-like n=1 Tax=Triticum dicoccoides TaxID=85692 RepID=UPI000E7B0473|nr:protein ROLLING AND ERECT LEAF 2-like [Triticum dicoccoides]